MFTFNKNRLVRQTSSNDCGAAALATICCYFGGRPELSDIKGLLPVDRQGTSLHFLLQAATILGLNPSAYKPGPEPLENVSLPFITSLGQHFVVVDKITSDRVIIADPARGWRELPRKLFCDTWGGIALTFNPLKKLTGATRQRSAFSYFWLFTSGTRSSLIKAIGLSFVGSIVGLAIPVLTQQIVDRGRLSHSGSFSSLLVGIAGALVLGLLMEIVRAMTVTRIATRSFIGFGSKFLRHMMRLPWIYFLNHSTGDAVNLIEQVQGAASFVGAHGASICVNVVLLAMSLIVVFHYQSSLGLYILGAMVLLLAIGLFVGRQMTEKMGRGLRIQAQAIGLFIEAIRKISLLKAYNCEELWARRWEERAKEAGSIMIAARDTITVFTGLMQTIFQALPFAIVMLGLGGAKPLSMGSLISVTAISTVALYSILDLSNNLVEYRKALVGLKKVVEVLHQKTEWEESISHDSAGVETFDFNTIISLRNMSFSYSPLSRPALRDISLAIGAGDMVAVIGPSGSGKTTLAYLLVGLLRPTEGDYLFGGMPTATMPVNKLRSRIALVHQECPLIEGTILENIAFGDDHPDEARAWQAAEMAQALDFILEHPLSFKRRLSEDGSGLSAGQRQRVAIARALYRNPEILVFDEPTSALDTESERKLIETLDSLKGLKTIIIVAHRLRTIKGVDTVLVLNSGQLVEFGSPDDLLRQSGYFSGMVHSGQSGSYAQSI